MNATISRLVFLAFLATALAGCAAAPGKQSLRGGDGGDVAALAADSGSPFPGPLYTRD